MSLKFFTVYKRSRGLQTAIVLSIWRMQSAATRDGCDFSFGIHAPHY